MIGAYGRDTRVSDNTFFSVPNGCTSRTFNDTGPADRKRIDYIITRQPHRKLVPNATVHFQPRADSDHNIVDRIRCYNLFICVGVDISIYVLRTVERIQYLSV